MPYRYLLELLRNKLLDRNSMERLVKEYEYFLSIREELIDKHPDEYVVIIGTTVDGYYESKIEAIIETRNRMNHDDFLVQKCVEEEVSCYHLDHEGPSFAI